jgi:hypothetical protein
MIRSLCGSGLTKANPRVAPEVSYCPRKSLCLARSSASRKAKKEAQMTDTGGSAVASLPPALALRRLIFSHRVTRIIVTAAQLGLADHLSDTPQSAAALAPLVQADVRALYRLLRALASIGVVTEVDPDRFALTPLGACLRTDAPRSMRAWALFEGAEYHQQTWSHLSYSVQTGAVAFDHALGVNFYQYMQQHPEARRSFDHAMVDFATLAAEAVVAAYNFSTFRQVVDVGGGYGTLLTTILQAYPSVQGVLFELPSLLEGAGQHIQASGVADRCALRGGDFFEAIPAGGDAYVLSWVLMAYDDDRCVRLLRNCHRAMAEQGRVLILQQVMPPPGGDALCDLLFEGTMSDLNMLVSGGGGERTEAEYAALLEAAGFKLMQVVPTQSLMSVIEGVRV